VGSRDVPVLLLNTARLSNLLVILYSVANGHNLSKFLHQLMHNWTVLKTNLNLHKNLHQKAPTRFGVNHHPQEAHYLSLAKLAEVWPHNEPHQCILTHFNNCKFSKAQIVCSLRMVIYTETCRSFLM